MNSAGSVPNCAGLGLFVCDFAEKRMRRVVVTGLGLVTPLGADVETVWANLLAGKSGAGPITRFDASNQKCQIACEVKPADHPYGFDASRRVDHKIQRQVDPFIVYGIDAAGQALEDAGLVDMDDDLKMRTGCSIGSGIGGLPGIESRSIVLHERPGPRFSALRPWPPDQPDLGPGLDQVWPDGAEPCGRHRLLHRRALDR
jgi:3-oxoacyl-(acyl-carrier-protein) synthase